MCFPFVELFLQGNGVRVGSQDTYDPMSCVGVGLDVGPIYESPEEQGLSTVLKRLILSSTEDGDEINDELLELGAHVRRSDLLCRDSIYVGAEMLRPNVEGFFKILSESWKNSRFSESDLEFQKQSLMFEKEDRMNRPDEFLSDLLASAAFGEKGYGLPPIPDQEVISKISMKDVTRFRDENLKGPRIAVCGVGIEHKELLSLAKDSFGDIDGKKNDRSFQCEYEGGTVMVPERQLVPPEPIHGARILLGFKAPGLRDEDHYIAYVLASLMGGGSAFSSGGPGKGMYSRLYTRVLNRYVFVQDCKCQLMPFEDVSLFTVTGKCDVEAVVAMINVFAAELVHLCTEISDEELMRAKNKLKSDLFVDLESRIVLFDDLCRQVLMWDKRVSPTYHASMIDKVNKDDMIRVARNIISNAYPTTVIYGPATIISQLPSSIGGEIQSFVTKNYNSTSKK